MALPTPTNYVTLGLGTVLDDVVDITSISCTYGRSNIAEQPSPSVFTCSYSLRQDNPTPPLVDIGDAIRWAIDDLAATADLSYVFFGYITDISQNIKDWRNGNGLIEYTITAVGPLARLQRDLLPSGTSFVKQFEGNRINTVMGYSTWPTYSIETPGDYEVAADNKGGDTVLSAVQTAAQSGMGLFYENLDELKYETFATRVNRSYSYLLGTQHVLATNLGTTQSVTTIANSINCTYGAGGGSTGTIYTDTVSKSAFGLLSGTRSTELHNVSDANTQAQMFLASRAYPRPRLKTAVINLENPAFTDALRSDLIATRVGQRISLIIPDQLGGEFDGFVESYSWSLGRNQRILTLSLSDYIENKPYTMWYNVPSTATWNTYATATTKWSDVQ